MKQNILSFLNSWVHSESSVKGPVRSNWSNCSCCLVRYYNVLVIAASRLYVCSNIRWIIYSFKSNKLILTRNNLYLVTPCASIACSSGKRIRTIFFLFLSDLITVLDAMKAVCLGGCKYAVEFFHHGAKWWELRVGVGLQIWVFLCVCGVSSTATCSVYNQRRPNYSLKFIAWLCVHPANISCNIYFFFSFRKEEDQIPDI